jgi:hypothetical protein
VVTREVVYDIYAEWCMTFMCLTRFDSLRSLHRQNAALLSQNTCNGPFKSKSLLSKANSRISFLKDMLYLAAALLA